MNKLILNGCAALAALALPAVAHAQAAAPAATAAVDPARLTEARKVIDLIMPPASREKTVRTMMNAMMANIAKAMNENPSFGSDKPEMREAMTRSIARMEKEMLDLIAPTMPAMSEAMAHAYARRFTLDQLEQMEAFFRSPAGQAYVANVADIFSDPDVVAWQRDLTQRQMARMPAMMDEILHDAEASAQTGANPAPKPPTK
jgi:hypothetical protein